MTLIINLRMLESWSLCSDVLVHLVLAVLM
jgi:hypothetical protein